MVTTVTSGELKIIEINVRGMGNKGLDIKKFICRKNKKADIVCIVDHKSSNDKKLSDQFAGSSYKVGAAYCRGTAAGGVALLQHEKLKNVRNAENKFKSELDFARNWGIDIAAIELNLKPKDCQAGIFVFGIYRRPGYKIYDFVKLICELITNVVKKYGSTPIFTGDFNINNNKEGQNTRSKSCQALLLEFTRKGYKLTHSKPSHVLGSALNNFLVPTELKYAQKTLCEVSGSHKTVSKQKPLPKKPDHLPIQIVITLEFHKSKSSLVNTEIDRGRGYFDINAPGPSFTQPVPKVNWHVEDGVVVIDSDDEGPTRSPTETSSMHNLSNTFSLNQYQTNAFVTRQNITLTRVKIEGESHPSASQVAGSHVGENPQINSIINSTDVNINRQYVCETRPSANYNVSNNVSSTSLDSILPATDSVPVASHWDQRETNARYLQSTGASTFRLSEVTTARTVATRVGAGFPSEPCSRPSASSQSQGMTQRERDLKRELEQLDRTQRKLLFLYELEEVKEKKAKIIDELEKMQ